MKRTLKLRTTNAIWRVLTKTDHTFTTALFELIDNSIGSMVDNSVDVDVYISGNWILNDKEKTKKLEKKFGVFNDKR